MASLSLTNFQTEVLLTLGNLQTSHPLISAGLHTRAINRVANDLVRAYPDRFPELYNSAATAAATVVGNNTIALPSNLILPTSFTRTESSSAPTLASTTEEALAQTTMENLGFMNKDSTTVGYPQLWARDGDNIQFWPTCRTGYTTYLIGYGIFGLTDLSSGSDTFAISAEWNDPIVLRASSRVAMKMGWTERAMELRAEAKMAEEELMKFKQPAPAMAVGAEWEPSRASVYGGV